MGSIDSTRYAWVNEKLDELYNQPINSPSYRIFRQVQQHCKGKRIVSVVDCAFDLQGYLTTRNVPSTAFAGADVANQHTTTVWSNSHDSDCKDVEIATVLQNGVIKVSVDGTTYDIYHFRYPNMGREMREYHFTFEGDSDAAGKQLVAAVYKWMTTLKEELWVFQGNWRKDKAMYASIQSAEWDDIVLDEASIKRLRRDTDAFFDSQQTYADLNVAWKRGILLLGPPGNGKTETIKALIKNSSYPCLYVKTFNTRMGPEQGIRMIFEKARQTAPCILVLEDLDSLIKPEVRSFFLNELDGFEGNSGILNLATTNHPERIDDAIIHRPSRFDTKYIFGLPSLELRKRYIVKWMQKTNAASLSTTNNPELADVIASMTEGWSFAFLKELFISFLLSSAAAESGQEDAIVDILEHVDILDKQVKKGESSIGGAVEERSRGDGTVHSHRVRARPV